MTLKSTSLALGEVSIWLMKPLYSANKLDRPVIIKTIRSKTNSNQNLAFVCMFWSKYSASGSTTAVIRKLHHRSNHRHFRNDKIPAHIIITEQTTIESWHDNSAFDGHKLLCATLNSDFAKSHTLCYIAVQLHERGSFLQLLGPALFHELIQVIWTRLWLR